MIKLTHKDLMDLVPKPYYVSDDTDLERKVKEAKFEGAMISVYNIIQNGMYTHDELMERVYETKSIMEELENQPTSIERTMKKAKVVGEIEFLKILQETFITETESLYKNNL